jgi:hypothetical protein
MSWTLEVNSLLIMSFILKLNSLLLMSSVPFLTCLFLLVCDTQDGEFMSAPAQNFELEGTNIQIHCRDAFHMANFVTRAAFGLFRFLTLCLSTIWI